jgi:hypothetical protein
MKSRVRGAIHARFSPLRVGQVWEGGGELKITRAIKN